jgi:SOS-response transcriptional repressor LexA
MKESLTATQLAVLRLAETRDISALSLRQIGELLGGIHPYTVQLAKKALIREGKLVENRRTGRVTIPQSSLGESRLLNIPILGRVSCGVATELANEGPHDFLSVSPSLIQTKRFDDIFALIAAGNSMNQASIKGKSVDDGDYVIVRKGEWSTAKEGDYVVSRIDNAHNLKKLHIDQINQRLVLLSESTEQYMPIFIASEDLDYYGIDGIAIDVVKSF